MLTVVWAIVVWVASAILHRPARRGLPGGQPRQSAGFPASRQVKHQKKRPTVLAHFAPCVRTVMHSAACPSPTSCQVMQNRPGVSRRNVYCHALKRSSPFSKSQLGNRHLPCPSLAHRCHPAFRRTHGRQNKRSTGAGLAAQQPNSVQGRKRRMRRARRVHE